MSATPSVPASPRPAARRRLGIAVFGAILFLAAAPALGQPQGWQKVEPREPRSAARTEPSLWSVALEVGFPGVFAPRVSFPVGSRQTVGAGPVVLPGLTGAVGEYRYHLIPPRRGRFVLNVGTGAAFYSIHSEGRSASAGAIFLSLGSGYRTRSRFLLGGSVGTMTTTGDESDDPVDSFGIRKGMSTAYVNVSVAYVF